MKLSDIRVMDVVQCTTDETLFINDCEFKPTEKLSELRDGTLGLLTGLTTEQFNDESIETLYSKIDEHLKSLTKRGFEISIVGENMITLYHL